MSKFALFPASHVGSCDSEVQMLQHLHSHLRVVLFNKSLNCSGGTGMAPKEGERWQHWKIRTKSDSERVCEAGPCRGGADQCPHLTLVPAVALALQWAQRPEPES